MKKRLFYNELIYKAFYYSPHLSCLELSSRIAKSIPFTARILNELIAGGSIEQDGLAPSNGGRRPHIYSVKPDALYILAVAMDQFITRIAVFDFSQKVVGGIQQISIGLAKNPNAIYQLSDYMELAIRKSKIPRDKILGAGIGMPGFIDTQKGMNYSFLPTDGVSIPCFLSKKLKFPIFIDNDSSLIALAEHRFGAAQEMKHAMVINLGWGVGLGLILNNQLYRGAEGFAGEFSHIPLYDNGKLCSCGKRGCLETETSLKVIIDHAAQGLKKKGHSDFLPKDFKVGDVEKDWQWIIKASQAGDPYTIELITKVGYDIGRGVATLIHLFNPETIVVSGRGAQVGRLWQAPIMQAVNEHCIHRMAANTSIKVSPLGARAELLGAAALVVENLGKQGL